MTDLFAFSPSPSVPKWWFPTQAKSRDSICRDKATLHFHCAPPCTSVQNHGWLLLQCTGWEDVLVAQFDPGCLGIIFLGNLELVTSMCTSQYSGQWDGTDGSAASWHIISSHLPAASWHIISHLPQPLALKWGPGYGLTEGKL